MFDRYSEPATRAMTLAREESRTLRNDYIGTEHLLLGLVGAEGGVAAQALKNLGLDPGRVRDEVVKLVAYGKSSTDGKQLPFTPRMKRILEWALKESRKLRHEHVGTEHLLLALVHEHDGPADCVLERLGVRPEVVRAAILELPPEAPPAGNSIKK